MDIQTLANKLQTAYIVDSGGKKSLQLPADKARDDLQSADIGSLLGSYMPGSPPRLVINDLEQPASPANQIVFTGTFHLFNANNPLRAKAVFYLENTATDGTPQLTLTLYPAGVNTFSQSFPALLNQVVDALQFTAPLFILESFTQDGSGEYTGISQGFNFSGNVLTASGPLTPVSWLFTGTSSMLMTGMLTSVTDPTTAPLMRLQTPPGDASIALGPTGFSMWVQAETEYAQPPVSLSSTPSLVTHVELRAEIDVKNGETSLRIPMSMELPEAPSGLLTFAIDLGNAAEIGLNNGLADLSALASGNPLGNLIPAQYPVGQDLSLQAFTLVIAPTIKQVSSLAMGVQLKNPQGGKVVWEIIPSILTLENISIVFSIADPLHPQLANISTMITAAFLIAEDFSIDISISLPDVTISGTLQEGDTIPLSAALSHFLGNVPIPSMTIVALDMSANPSYKTYSLSCEIQEDWELDLGPFKLILQSIYFEINRDQTSSTGQFIASLSFLATDFVISAQYPGTGGWIFTGQLAPGASLSLQHLADQVLPSDWPKLPDEVKDLALTMLDVAFETTDDTYRFQAGIQWPLIVGGDTFEIDAGLDLQSHRRLDGDKSKDPYYSGQVEGSFSFHNLQLTAGYKFDQGSKDIYFKFNELLVDYIRTYDEQKKLIDEKLHISFGNLTVGEILEFLIKLADPGASGNLSAPWDALNSINLQNLVLIVDFTKRSIEVDYTLNVSLDFISIQKFGIVYTREYDQGKVNIVLTGSFLDQTYTDGNPLTWDALNEQPPAMPGAGTKLIDIEYLGLGQHISLQDEQQVDTVTKAIQRLEATVVPVDDLSKAPLNQTTGLVFNSGSNWLIGAKFTILETFSLDIVFNDPEIYGLLLDVSGPRAGSFEGLSFEILYRKVTDKIGVFHIELKLPDAMRHLEFGEVSVTLPIVTLDIYTNGNFRIDFGFPPSLDDWSRSLAVEVFPFVGYAGFYFALLSGDTSTRVPRISNGNFNPVIEFGFALLVGVGKTIDEGILSAGISIAVVGMLQGVIAWFHPNDQSTPQDIYYWLQGTIGIVGIVFGTVDFVVIKASVSLTAYASVTLIIEAYQPIVISLVAGVEVSVSVGFLFITIHFSFSATIHATFSIGSALPTPWKVIPVSQPQAQSQLRPQQPLLRNQAGLHSVRPVFAAMALPQRTRVLQPQARKLRILNLAMPATEPPDTITLKLVPAFSQALLADLKQSGDKPVATCTVLLFVENSIPLTAPTHQALMKPAANVDTAPFNTLMNRMLKWLIKGLENETDTVTAAELSDIFQQLNDDKVIATYFSYDNLAAFCHDNLIFRIEPRPATAEDSLSATFFPMIPELTLTDTNGLQRSFRPPNDPPVPSGYEEKINQYFQHLMVEYENSVEKAPDGTGTTTPQAAAVPRATAPSDSMAQYMFRSYFCMLARSVAQTAIDLLRTYRYTVADPVHESLASIADSFPAGAITYVVADGDTVNFIAAHFAVTDADNSQANPGVDVNNLTPGQRLIIPLKVTPESIVIANQSADVLNSRVPPQTPCTFDVHGVKYQIRAGDSLASIAQSFVLQSGVQPGDLIGANADTLGLLRLNASVQIGTLTYTVRVGDTLQSIETYFGVQDKDISSTSITPGQQITIANVVHTVRGGFPIPYTVGVGDTLQSIIARYFPQVTGPDELKNLESLITIWNPTVDFSKPLQPGSPLAIPYTDTFNNIAHYYGITLETMQQEVNIANTALLMPLAVLQLPISYTIQPNDTFASIAQRFNLSLAELTPSIASVTNVFRLAHEGTDPVTITVPNVPALPIAQLTQKLGQSGQYNNAAAMISRFLLHGLRLPDPQDQQFATSRAMPAPAVSAGAGAALDVAEVKTYPLYTLTGQEFPVPSSISTNYQLTVTNTGSVPWVTFPNPNPAASPPNQLTLPLTSDEVSQIKAFGTAMFSPQITGPTRLPLYAYAPDRYTLQQQKHWQAAVLPTGLDLMQKGQKVGEPAIWMLPDALQRKVSGAQGAALLYQIIVGTHTDGSSAMQTTDIQDYFWSTAVTIGVQEITSSDFRGRTMPNSYLVTGADDAGKRTLLEVWNYLTGPDGRGDKATLYLLYQPDPSSVNSQGLVSDDIDRTNTFLLKTNLSPLSSSGAPQALTRFLREALVTPEPPENYAATIEAANSRNFLKLLWECSVVKSGGFYLNYQNQNGATGLPGYLFTQGTGTTLTLLIVLDSQSQSRRQFIRSFNNCAVIGDNIDASTSNVFVQPPTYVVQAGGKDTLSSIAQKSYIPGIDAVTLALANQQVKNVLRPGATVLVNTTNYTILPGDTFASVAAQFAQAQPAVTVATLATANQTADILEVGAVMQFAEGQLTLQPVVPPGNVGFQMSRPNPVPVNGKPGDTATPQQQLDVLFDLLGYSIAPNTYFAESGEGLPVGPVRSTQFAAPPTPPTASAASGSGLATGEYRYAVTFILQGGETTPGPVATVTTTSGVQEVNLTNISAGPSSNSAMQPTVQVLARAIYRSQVNGNTLYYLTTINDRTTTTYVDIAPDSALSTDRTPPTVDTTWYYKHLLSISRFATYNEASDSPALPAKADNPYAGIRSGAEVELRFDFHDLYGCRTKSDQPIPNLPIKVGYFDDLIDLSQWPSVASDYVFTPSGAQALLTVNLSFRISRYLPAPGTSYQVSHNSARVHAETFKRIYYQLAQKDVSIALDTSMGTINAASEVNDAARLTLLNFVTSIYLFLSTAQQLTAYYPSIAAGETLGAIAKAYSVSPGALATANKDVELSNFFQTDHGAGIKFNIPQYYVFKAADTINNVYADPRLADTKPEDRLPLIAKNNSGLALKTGVVITTQARTFQVNASQQLTLLGIANQKNTTVAELANANPDKPLTQGLRLTVADVTLPTDSAATLNTMAKSFAAQFAAKGNNLNVTVAYLAVANQLLPNFFADGTNLTIPKYVVQPGDTLASIAAHIGPADPAQLLSANTNLQDSTQSVQDLYEAGTPLYLVNAPHAVQADDTFASIAQQFFLSLDDLANYNQQAAFRATQKLNIPYLVENNSTGYSAYEALGSETFEQIIGKYPGWTIQGLLDLNHDVQGIFNPQPLHIGTMPPVTPTLEDTFDTLAAKFGLTTAVFAADVAAMSGVIRQGALILCPAMAVHSGDMLTTLAQRYNVSIAGIAQANSSVYGLLSWPGAPQTQTVTYNGQSYTIQSNDTLVTIASRFNQLLGVNDTTVQAVADANPSLQLRPGAFLVPPPRPPQINAAVTPSYTRPIFEVTVALEISRDKDNHGLIAPEFSDDARVKTARTQITAQPFEDQVLDNGSKAMSLNTFAQQFEQAFTGIKLATGAHQRIAGGAMPSQKQLWAVNFGESKPNGYQYRALGDQSRFYALKPLSTQLWTATDVPVYSYSHDAGLSTTPIKQNFQNVDLEDWLRMLLAAIDLFLSPEYLVPVYKLDTSGKPNYKRVVFAKERIADALQRRVDYVLKTTNEPPQYLPAAQKALYEQALISLANAYQTDVLIQCPFWVSSPDTDPNVAPRLSGKPVANGFPPPWGNATRVGFTPQSDSTFVKIADYFGVTVQDVVTANQDVPDVFVPTTTITLKGKTETVAIGDTLLTLARKFYPNIADPTTALSTFANDLWQADLTTRTTPSYTLNTKTPLYSQQFIPVYSFSSGKVPLTDQGSLVTFLFNVRDVAQHKAVFLDLDYVISEIEFAVQPPSVDGYQESSWLSFIIPTRASGSQIGQNSSKIGQLQIPIPLRDYPTFPVLSNQEAIFGRPATNTAASGDSNSYKDWTYGLQLEHQSSAQDTLYLDIAFNVVSNDVFDAFKLPPQGADVSSALAQALAQFAFAYPALQNDLLLLLSPDAASHTDMLTRAIAAFATLVQRVADAWDTPAQMSRLLAVSDQDQITEPHRYQLETIVNESNPGHYAYLVMHSLDNDPSTTVWPTITAASTGQPVQPVEPLQDQPNVAKAFVYQEAIANPIDLKFDFSGLDVIMRQNGWGGASVTRNENLIGNPTPGNSSTNEAFVYRTPLSLFSNRVTPLISDNDFIPLDTSMVLDEALSKFFKDLFAVPPGFWPEGQRINVTVAARYGYSLVSIPTMPALRANVRDASTMIVTYIPLVLSPNYQFDPTSDWDSNNSNSFVQLLTRAVQSTAQQAGVRTDAGMYIFDISVYSTIKTSFSRPILELRNVYFDLTLKR